MKSCETYKKCGEITCGNDTKKLSYWEGKRRKKIHSYRVMLDGEEIDVVFYNTKQDIEDVKRALVEHDGYNSNIKVEPEK